MKNKTKMAELKQNAVMFNDDSISLKDVVLQRVMIIFQADHKFVIARFRVKVR